MTTQNTLAKAFDARKSFFAHRASAVFPLRIREHSDLRVLFMNYWLLKNDIPSVGVNFRVYGHDGTLRARQSLGEVAQHNDVSVREVLLRPNAVPLPFDGMLEVEIVSTSNLAFPFPAILGVYEANGLFSCVHAAGRVKNPDEIKKPQRSEETNWSCSFERRDGAYAVVPFFHYFVGASPLAPDEAIEVKLRDPAGKVLVSRQVQVGDMGPFSSRLFFADELFDLAQAPPAGSFLSVALRANDIFPRLVVGNFHREVDFLEVTHSFPVTEFTDHCPKLDPARADSSFASLLAAQTAPGLALELRVFPTNCAGRVSAVTRRKRYGDDRLADDGEGFEFESSPGNEGLDLTLAAGEEFRVLHLQGETIPSRLNASYRYRVEGAPRRFATDIATGAKSIVYPPKWRHWGHGCIGGGFDTYVLLRNNTHSPSKTVANAGDIRLFSHSFDKTIRVECAAESCAAIRLSQVLDLDPTAGEPVFVSWLMSLEQPVGETFWVAFRPDGAVFGEHGF